MRGLFSAAPGPSAIRLTFGSHLLLMIQAGLVLWSDPRGDLPLRMLVAMVLVVAASALVAAIHGLSDDERQPVWRRRNDR